MLLVLLLAVLAGSCGGNCPSGSCTSCPCGSSKNIVSSSTLQGYMQSAGLNTSVFLCIAQHESGLNANAMNVNGANIVAGVFQENNNNGYSAQQLCNPQTACQAAVALMKECGICPWIDDPWYCACDIVFR
jgi:hypothetical protein